MLRGIAMLLALGAPAMAAASARQLQDEASAHAGQPVRLDERLAVPACPSGFRFRAPEARTDSLEASCPDSGWRILLPLAAAPQPSLPRRGQLLRVVVEGPGYRASAEGVVEAANPREGTLLMRNARSGARFSARIQPDGQITANFSTGR